MASDDRREPRDARSADLQAPRSHGYRVGKWVRLLIIIGIAVVVDIATKAAIVRWLLLYQQLDVVGEYVRLTYIHNSGAAFGISLGRYSHVIFGVLSGVAITALVSMYASTPAEHTRRLNAIALICGGAAGNLWNRMVVRAGVVDWIDVGIGSVRWPVFNVADIAVTIGAIALAVSLWREDASGRLGDRRSRG